MSPAVQGGSLKKPQYLTRTEWYDLTETCFQSPSCMRTRNKLNLLRNTKLNFYAFRTTVKPSQGSREVLNKIWARSVQSFWRLLDTHRQIDKTDRQAKYFYSYFPCTIYSLEKSSVQCTESTRNCEIRRRLVLWFK